MNWGAIAGIAAVAAVIVTMLGGLVLLSWNAGRHSQRLDRAEGDIRDLSKTQDEHSKLLGGWEQFRELLNEVRGDVKKLLLERGRQTSR